MWWRASWLPLVLPGAEDDLFSKGESREVPGSQGDRPTRLCLFKILGLVCSGVGCD